MARVLKREAAKRDLIRHYVYLAEHAGLETAERFLAQAVATFSDLAERPSLGVRLAPEGAEISAMRRWRVKEFGKFLIFDVPRTDGVSIVRVLHAAQDWWSALGLA